MTRTMLMHNKLVRIEKRTELKKVSTSIEKEKNKVDLNNKG